MSEKLYLAGDKIIRVLIIDDDPTICNILQEVLESHGYQAIFATSGQAGLDAFLQLLPEIVLLDQELPDQKGLTICRKLLQLNPEIKIIFITAYPACNYAIEAVKAGAYDYIPKPFYPEEVLLLLQNAVNSYELERIRDFYRYKEGMEARHEELASQSLQMKSVHQLLLAAEGRSSWMKSATCPSIFRRNF
jgi:DNA-binding NtrC family response regulator